MPIFCAELGGMPAPVIPAAAELRIDLAADEARDEVLPFPFNLVEESYHIIKNNFRIALNIQDVIIISTFVCSIQVITLLLLPSLAAERELFSD